MMSITKCFPLTGVTTVVGGAEHIGRTRASPLTVMDEAPSFVVSFG